MKGLVFSLVLMLFSCLYLDLWAQGNIPPPPPQNPPPPVPITGIEYLLVGGGIYGIYRFSKKRNKDKEA